MVKSAVLNRSIEQLSAAVVFYQRVLEHGHKKDVCIACSRGLSKEELPAFEAYVSGKSFSGCPMTFRLRALQCKKQMATNPATIQEAEAELSEWQSVLSDFKKLEPLAATAKKLREADIPKFDEEVQRTSGKHKNAIEKAQEAGNRVTELRSTIRELESLKLVATDISRLLSETKDLSRDVQSLERQLESSGSARTADDVQDELAKLGNDMYES